MIGYLTGTVVVHDRGTCILSTNGVGYRVVLSPRVARQHLEKGKKLELFIHTHVRDDEISLYGFETIRERDLFELLLTVSGVGPKTALSVLALGSPEEIQTAISAANVEFFLEVSGIGKKTGQRIIVDLKGKMGSIEELDLTGEQSGVRRDLVRALKGMGFDTGEINEAVKSIDRNAPFEEQLRQALKRTGTSNAPRTSNVLKGKR